MEKRSRSCRENRRSRKKTGLWKENLSPEMVKMMIEDVKKGKFTKNGAAKHYGIPQTSFKRLFKNGVVTMPGKKRTLLKELEDDLCKWICGMSMFGMSVFPKTIIKKANLLREEYTDVEKPLGKIWFFEFLRRYKNLITGRTGKSLSKDRMGAMKENHIDEFFKLFEKVKLEKKVKDDNIFNMDEMGALKKKTNRKAYGYVKLKNYYIDTQSKDKSKLITVMGTIGRNTVFPPVFVFPGKRYLEKLKESISGIVGASFSMSPKGWINGKIMENYGYRFLSSLQKIRSEDFGKEYFILLVDGHPCHFDPRFLELSPRPKLNTGKS